MNVAEFREFAKTAIDYISDYLETIRSKQVLPSVEAGYLKNELPAQAPNFGEPWQKVLEDIDKIIVPGLTHWHSPNFHAYYPTANSYPGIVGELFLSGLSIVSTNWLANPAVVELELKMMDWLGRLLKLPEEFLNSSPGPGGGLIQNGASESTLTALLTGKRKKIEESLGNSNFTTAQIQMKLVAYTSDQSNSSVEKAGLIASVPFRLLPTNEEDSLKASTLDDAILKDLSEGYIPCCVVISLGTTGTCAYDDIKEIGPICQKYNLWLHIDAAYAGAALSCPEYQHLIDGIEFVDSIAMNPHKWMLVNSDCSAMWFRNAIHVEDALRLKNPLEDEFGEKDIKNWQIPDIRRFRGLKLWFVLRIYGVDGIQKHIRHQISLAQYFTSLIENDPRFELCVSRMGLVCFRVKGKDFITQQLIDKITERRELFMTPYYYKNKLVVRFVIVSRVTEKFDLDFAWSEICRVLDDECGKFEIG